MRRAVISLLLLSGCGSTPATPDKERPAVEAEPEAPETPEAPEMPAIDPMRERVTSSVTVGSLHTCAIVDGGRVACFGANGAGQRGDEDRADRHAPALVEGIDGVVELCAGRAHTCARREDGSVRCWGYLGERIVEPREAAFTHSSPTAIAELPAAVSIACGAHFGCAATRDGEVRCFGYPGRDEDPCSPDFDPDCDPDEVMLENARAAWTARPVRDLSSAVEVAATDHGAMARLEDGSVHYWGWHPPTQGRATLAHPRELALRGPATRLYGWARYFCAAQSEGPWLCHGEGSQRLLRTEPAYWQRDRYVAMGDSERMIALAGGERYLCAAFDDHHVYCWGEAFDDIGQRDFGEVRDVTALAAGPGHLCWRDGEGALYCVGDGSRGQLGAPPPEGAHRRPLTIGYDNDVEDEEERLRFAHVAREPVRVELP